MAEALSILQRGDFLRYRLLRILVALAASSLNVQNQQENCGNQHKQDAGNKTKIVNLH